jgi:hypothetical protein
MVAGVLGAAPVASHAEGPDAPTPVTKGAITIPDERVLSAGAWAFFHGVDVQPGEAGSASSTSAYPAFGTNVDANDPTKDVAAGQAETAIAAATFGSQKRVLAAWNDVSGFFFRHSTTRDASVTGLSISTDGGASFRDQIGLPNHDPNQQWFGDPTVVAVDGSHFIVGSLYLPAFFAEDFCAGEAALGLSVATVNASGSKVTFTDPIVAASGGSICSDTGAFLDKEFLAYDATTRTLAMSYTRFGPPCGNGGIEVVRATVPADAATLSSNDFGLPIVVWPQQCSGAMVNAGSYPAVSTSGDVFVAWERNIFSNQFNGKPYVWLHAAKIPAGALAPSVGGPANPVVITTGQTNGTKDGGVKSMDMVQIVGYSRFVGVDFPRAAFNPATGGVVFAWNDSSLHPLGDIFLRELNSSLSNLATSPIRKVNGDGLGRLHFLPALSVRSNGTICLGWYDRRRFANDSARTDYYRDCRASAGLNGTDTRVTTGYTDWNATGSIINPNFGDYTDAASDGNTTYYIWTDGRTGYPQPFVDKS